MSVAAKISFSLVLFFPGLAVAGQVAPDAQSLRELCSDSSQVEIHECLSKKEATSAQELALVEKRLKQVLGRWDEDEPYREEARAALVVANQRFVDYRAEQCAFQEALSGGAAGNTREILRLSCVAALNYQRVMQLQSAASEVPGR